MAHIYTSDIEGYADMPRGPQYHVKCDKCKAFIRHTHSIVESAAGGLCDACADYAKRRAVVNRLERRRSATESIAAMSPLAAEADEAYGSIMADDYSDAPEHTGP